MPIERPPEGALRTDAEVAQAWDDNAEQWVRHVRAGWDKLRETFNNPMFFAFAPELADRAVIDLGCGEGRNTREIAQRGARVMGIDVSRKMIAAAQAAEAREPLGISYHVASFSRLDCCADESFDLALSTMALMDGPDFVGAARDDLLEVLQRDIHGVVHRRRATGGRLADGAFELGQSAIGRRGDDDLKRAGKLSRRLHRG